MNRLDLISQFTGLQRIYYGDAFTNKPNDHCYWDDGAYSHVIGWYENDEHLRERVLEKSKLVVNDSIDPLLKEK